MCLPLQRETKNNKIMLESLKKLFGIQPKADFAVLVQQGAVIIDVRTKGEYSSGHIRGSVNIPLDKLIGSIGKFKDKNQSIILCCASGARSATAHGVLSARGYTNVHNGGSWISLNRKLN
jgi:phage shock protein E